MRHSTTAIIASAFAFLASTNSAAQVIEEIVVTGTRLQAQPIPYALMDQMRDLFLFGNHAGGYAGGSGSGTAGEGTEDPQPEDDENQEDPCNPSSGNPVIIATGEKIQEEIDLEDTGQSGPQIVRRYSNSRNYQGIFGQNWISNFDYYLDLQIVSGEITGAILQRGMDSRNTLHPYTQSNGAVTWHRADGRPVRLMQLPDGRWQFNSDGGTSEMYAADGKLISAINADTNSAVVFTYSGSMLTKVMYSGGGSLIFSYSAGRISTITDSSGNIWTYQTNSAFGNVTNVSYPDGGFKQYLYQSGNNANLVGILFDGVPYATWTYDSQNRALASEHAGGVDKVLFSYNSSGDVTTTNPRGKQTIYKTQVINGRRVVTNVNGQSSANCVASFATYNYNDLGQRTSSFDQKSNLTKYAYNAYGETLKVTEAAFTPEELVTETVWHEWYSKPVSHTRGNLAETFSYDDSGRLTHYQQTDLSTSDTRSWNHTYQFHANGFVSQKSVDGPRSGTQDVTLFNYDDFGRLTSIQNALGHITSFSNFDAMGRPRRVTDPNGAVTDFDYTARGRLDQTTQSGGRVTQYEYGTAGNITRITFPDGAQRTYTYSDALRLTDERNNLDNQIRHIYDWAGNEVYRFVDNLETTAISNPNCTPAPGEPCPPLWVDEWVQYFESDTYYDELNRPINTTSGTASTNYTYDKNSNLKTVESEGHTTLYSYDGLNRVSQITQPDATTTTLTYDTHGRVAAVTDPRGNATFYTYNAFGDLLQLNSPDTGITTYSYDDAGNRLSQQLANAKSSTFGYDALNRMTSRNSGSLSQVLTYDSCLNGKGRLCKVTDYSGRTEFTYNADGQVASKTQVVDSQTYALSYGYDAYGNLTSITYPSGRKLTYNRLAQGEGRLSSIDFKIGSTTSTLLNGVQYLPFGGIKQFAHGNGLKRNAEFNSGAQLVSLYYGKGYNASPLDGGGFTMQNPKVLKHNYALDEAGNITSLTSGYGIVKNRSFSYDSRSRLSTVSNNSTPTESYGYDANGNRITQTLGGTSTAYQYTASANRLQAKAVGGGSWSYDWAYDNSGNQITKATDTFVYGDENRLSRHTQSGANTDYLYNALGQRVKKTGPGGTYRYVYDLDGKLLAEYAGASLAKEYLWMGGQLVGLTYNGTMYYVHTDHLGRPEIVADSSKTVVWKADNRAFERDVLTNTIGGLNLGFPGQYYDSEKDSWYNYFRDYDANTGRYIQSDPIGLGGGMNTYGYVSGNPLIYIDPYGQHCMSPEEIGAAVGGVVGGISGLPLAARTKGLSVVIGASGGAALGYLTAADFPSSNLAGPLNSTLAAAYSNFTARGGPSSGTLFGGLAAGLFSDAFGRGPVANVTGAAVGASAAAFFAPGRAWATTGAAARSSTLIAVVAAAAGEGLQAILEATRDENCPCE